MNMGYTAAGWTYLADEHHIYGSSRVGVHNTNFVLAKRFSNAEMEYTQKTGNQVHFIRGKRNYELSNHLGNVQVVISDKRISVCDNELQTERFEADILMATDYYPFGMAIPELQWYTGSDSSNYRFGFNGMEKDKEVSGVGCSYTAEFWQYDSRLGRRFNTDPVFIASESPYACFRNNPIFFVDPRGDSSWVTKNEDGTHTLHITGKILNYTNNPSPNAEEFENQFKAAFADIEFLKIDIQFEVVESIDEVNENDHLIVMVDEIAGGGNGVSWLCGQVSYVDGGLSSSSLYNAMIHELGHDLGLYHPNTKGDGVTDDTGTENMMSLPSRNFITGVSDRRSKFSRQQAQRIINLHTNKKTFAQLNYNSPFTIISDVDYNLLEYAWEAYYNNETESDKPYRGVLYKGMRIPTPIPDE